MRCTLSQSALAQAISYVQAAIPSRPPLPILSSILFSAEGSKITLAATDLYFGVQISLPAEITEEGVCALPGKQFAELVKALPAGQIEFSTTDQTLKVSTERIKSTIQFLPGNDFPVFPDNQGKLLQVPISLITTIVDQVAIACSPDVARPLLTGVLWEPGQRCTFVATDGFRLAHLKSEYAWQADEKIVVPARFWNELARVAEQEKTEMIDLMYDQSQKQITARINQVMIYSRTLEGDYPPYEKIMPSESSITVVLQAEELLEHIRRSLLYARDSLGTITLRFDKEVCKITAQSSALGSFEAELTTAQLRGEPINIAFNSKYILDFLQIIKSGEIAIGMNGELKPAVLTSVNKPGLTYVAMPFRVNQ